ncbi:MAG TPA: hypothetical protein VJ826_01290 [Candidatus Polarisedimenticolaceae bacterium]|nr:hypothetical protein [Candidatus Polarisedimenticolaceae bacterium]
MISTPTAALAFFLASGPEPIRDNSFLLEEAYNQEAGVVQHITTYQRTRGNAWTLGFTQEWPVGSVKNQLSYTIAHLDPGPESPGFGDAAVHWRYQLLGAADPKVALAPRVSVVVPFGDAEKGLGEGGPGLQVNLPLSVELPRGFVTHVNFGATHFFHAQSEAGDEADLTLFHFGQSLIWHARPRLDLMLEALYVSGERIVAPGATEDEQTFLLSPGVRWAHDLGNLQIVPGIAVPLGLGPSSGDRSVFFYLSFEHPFK